MFLMAGMPAVLLVFFFQDCSALLAINWNVLVLRGVEIAMHSLTVKCVFAEVIVPFIDCFLFFFPPLCVCVNQFSGGCCCFSNLLL